MNDPNRHMLVRVVEALGPLRDDFVFVGGSIVGLLVRRAAGREIRPTDDVDCVTEVATIHDYHAVEARLRSLGWKQDIATPGPICRYILDDGAGKLQVDVMPTREDILGFGGGFADEAALRADAHEVDGHRIKVVAPPYFLIMKLAAFADRGNGDFYGSHDLEDLVVVLDGCPDIVEQAEQKTTVQARSHLRQQLAGIAERLSTDTVPGVLMGDDARIEIARERLAQLTRGDV